MNRNFLVVALVAGAFGAGAFAAGGSKLYVNGKVASSDVRVINGSSYVKVTDVAKALDMVVVKRSDGLEIKKEGGTYQVGDLTGKIGDKLFDGQWRFSVVSVETVPSYTMTTSSEPSTNLYASSEWNMTSRALTAKPGYKLIVIRCHVNNGQKSAQQLWTAPSDDKLRTALADTNSASHPPLAYDYEGGPNHTQALVPGAHLTFPVIFGVPVTTELKDLIFTLKNRDTFAKGNDARVSLTAGNAAESASTDETEPAAAKETPPATPSTPAVKSPIKPTRKPAGGSGAKPPTGNTKPPTEKSQDLDDF